MWSESYDWHFDYPRLAFDAGFSFKSRKTKSSFEKEYIKNVDIGKLIQDRNASAVEKYIPSVIEFSLDNDQTSILDPTFLKIFQLSQLAVEYLLFCKKYLDNTVVILKKGILSNAEEIADLKQELQQKDEVIELLELKMKEKNFSKLQYHTYKDDASAFQCPVCCKVFATKEFLEAHNKRRHQESQATSAFQLETDKLQTEIKELKERLNTTEKLVHKNEYPKREFLPPSDEIGVMNDDKKLINELHQKFELLKVYVERELKSLQFQSADQSKYEKWFEVFLQRLESLMQKSYSTNSENQDQLPHNKIDLTIKKSDSSVQTEENFIQRNVCEKCEARNKEKNDFSRNQTQLVGKMLKDLKETTENQLNSLEFTLTKKVNGSLEKLDGQIRNLNKKVDEMVAKSQTKVENISSKASNEYSDVAPVPKKRQFIPGKKANKSVVDDKVNIKESNKFDSSIKVVIPPKLDQEKNKSIVPKTIENKKSSTVDFTKLKKNQSSELVDKSSTSNNSSSIKILFNKITTDEDSSTSSVKYEDAVKEDYVKIKPSISTLGKRSITSLKAASLDKVVLQGLKEEVQNIFDKRLAAVGISASKKGITNSIYEKALSIIHKERNEMVEKYPQYEKIAKDITKTLEERITSNQKYRKPEENISENFIKTEPSKLMVKKSSQMQKRKTKKVEATQQQRAQETSSSMSSSSEEDDKIPTDDLIERLTKPNKSLQKSYQSYSDVVKQINEKMQKRELQKNNISVLENDANDVEDSSKKNFSNVQRKEVENKEIKESEDKFAKMDVISIESFTEEIVEDRNEKKNNFYVEALGEKINQQYPKSAIRNLPTKILPVKKKVFFDLESMVNEEKKEDLGGGGDTTSATSSIFDEIETPKESKKIANKEKDSDDFSDFNFSDIL